MKVLQFRALIFLSILYLGLVALLYHFLWSKHTFEKLFESPGHQTSEFVSMEQDYMNDTGTDNEFVQFNFKRQNPLLEPTNNHGSVENGKGSSQRVRTQSSKAVSTSVGHSQKQWPSGHEDIAGLNSQPHSSRPVPAALGNSSNESDPRLLVLDMPAPNYCLHAFYYMWYGNREVDGRYLHWNHRYLPHWDDKITQKYPKGRHSPPDDIGASFYPRLGCYSSKDLHTMETHMLQLRQAGVGVIAVSWYPPGIADDEGTPPDSLIPQLLDTAQKYDIKVAFHIEPYRDRNPRSVREDLKYIHEHYGNHLAVYRVQRSRQDKGDDTKKFPVVYIYDSYLSPAREWGKVFRANGKLSIRDTKFDCVAVSLLVEQKHKQFILDGGFDGFYTYFASSGFSYGSSTQHWQELSAFANHNQLLFIPSIGPGYEDTRVRPWNSRNSMGRKNGDYYQAMFEAALNHHHGGLLSITSFNEWHEGTQIEPAVPKKIPGYTYVDYSPHSPDYYLDMTRSFSRQLECFD